jgi:DNA-binding MarR family transcriptional regulator
MPHRQSRVQGELKQTTPSRTVAQELVASLLRTSGLLRRQAAAVIEPEGITLQQYNVLRILRGAGPDGLPTLEIAERMIEQAPGITRLLDRLERKKLVRRERGLADRRRVTCGITDLGLDLLARLDRPVERLDEAVLGSLGPGEQERMVRLLDRLRETLAPGD